MIAETQVILVPRMHMDGTLTKFPAKSQARNAATAACRLGQLRPIPWAPRLLLVEHGTSPYDLLRSNEGVREGGPDPQNRERWSMPFDL